VSAGEELCPSASIYQGSLAGGCLLLFANVLEAVFAEVCARHLPLTE
jgi:hypothetical protein